ncbi:permease [Paenibacillus curdlanolyticus YK9]|uniref:Permease n=1 Tax=Paenibacillus curdlanolyticus YK9 TaxID=717606 RepID=E0IFP0_9BACL|nr:permease [Paenibacillus curdlanolyticus]EFM08706.1 permease [Paenibacillus curdlanolyticus YK9]
MRFLLRWSPPLLTLGCAAMIALIAVNRSESLPAIGRAELNSFTMLFLGVILEALPFMLLGVLVSAILQVFVSENLIRAIAPKHAVLGSIFGGLLGILFPLCECGMIPVVRRLIRKGMPPYVGIVYILAGPIVNPVVFASTYTAFRGQPDIVYARMILGFLVAFVIGLILYRFMKSNPLKDAAANKTDHGHHHTGHSHHENHGNGHDHNHDHVHRHDEHSHLHKHVHSHTHEHELPKGFGGRLASTLGHASEEFFDMGKYLLFGALLTAVIQTGLDRESIASLASIPGLSHVFMMLFAYILSLCSTSDAFIAASFSGLFTSGPLLAFLVFGPMIDLKNTLMLLSVFRIRVVIAIISLTAILVLTMTWLTELLLR